MNRHAQYVVLVLLGTTVTRTAATDLSLRYVREGMRPFLLAAGLVLLVLGLAGAVRELRRDAQARQGTTDDDAHDEPAQDGHGNDGGEHEHGTTRAAWLLVVPAVCLLVVAPPALGSFSADRARPLDVTAVREAVDFPPLPATPPEVPVELTFVEFSSRALWQDGVGLDGRVVSLTGFRTDAADGAQAAGAGGDGWLLTRMVLQCCAADALTVRVRVVGTPPPPAGAWVTVEGAYAPTPAGERVAVLRAQRVVTVPEPRNPYD